MCVGVKKIINEFYSKKIIEEKEKVNPLEYSSTKSLSDHAQIDPQSSPMATARIDKIHHGIPMNNKGKAAMPRINPATQKLSSLLKKISQ